MRVSKKALRPFAVILVSLSMSALLTGCQTSSDHRRLQFGDE